MKDTDLEFVCRVLSIFDGFDGLGNGSLWWRTDGEYAPVTALVNCNDFFNYAIALCIAALRAKEGEK